MPPTKTPISKIARGHFSKADHHEDELASLKHAAPFAGDPMPMPGRIDPIGRHHEHADGQGLAEPPPGLAPAGIASEGPKRL